MCTAPPEKGGENCDFIYNFLRGARHIAEGDDHFLRKSYRFSHFSDSFAISFTYEDTVGIDYILASLDILIDKAITTQQTLLSKKGVLSRGALTVGKLFHNGKFIFGPAIVEAGELEKCAKFPRIIISDAIRKNIKSLESKSRMGMRVSHYFDEDSDGRYYIKYIETLSELRGEGILRRIRDFCHDSIKKFPSECLKYNWVLQKLDIREDLI
jgi:hypothetical protein